MPMETIELRHEDGTPGPGATRLGNNVAWMCVNCERETPLLHSCLFGTGGVACPDCHCYYTVIRTRFPERVDFGGNAPA